MQCGRASAASAPMVWTLLKTIVDSDEPRVDLARRHLGGAPIGACCAQPRSTSSSSPPMSSIERSREKLIVLFVDGLFSLRYYIFSSRIGWDAARCWWAAMTHQLSVDAERGAY